MKSILVGDMHVVPDELEDCSRLLQYILDLARTDDEIREVWFSGDQHHTNAVVRLEVLHWWKVAFKALRANGLNVVCLVGNHDQSFPGSNIHAMIAYEGTGVCVVDKPVVHRGILFLPYYHDQKKFLDACNEHYRPLPLANGYVRVNSAGELDTYNEGPRTRTVICHQTFDGSRYENGIFASDGFDSTQVPQDFIVSGHIHTPQEFGKIWYIGAPRWRSLSDANVERAVWVVEFNSDGSLKSRTPFSTGEVCRQIKHEDDSPERPVQLPLDARHEWRIDIKGPPDWCHARKSLFSAAGARVRTFPVRASSIGRVRESDGVERAFRSYLDSFQAKRGTDRDILKGMVKERLGA